MMAESPDWSSGKDKGDGPKKAIEGNLQIWVPASFGEDLGTVATDDLQGTPITVQTISDTEYTFSFSNVSGRALKFYDAELDSLTDITNTNVYVCQLEKNTTIANRFSIYKPSEPTICHQYGKLIITGHVGDKVKVLDMEGEEAIAEQTIIKDTHKITLSDHSLTSGEQYKVVLGEDTMIIRVQ